MLTELFVKKKKELCEKESFFVKKVFLKSFFTLKGFF